MPSRRWPLVLQLFLFSAVCMGTTWAVLHMIGRAFDWRHVAIVMYLALATFALHVWQEHGMVTDPGGFVRRFMTGLVLKMFVSVLLLVAIVMVLPRDEGIPLALIFTLLYLAFLVFSTVRSTVLLRRSPGPPAQRPT